MTTKNGFTHTPEYWRMILLLMSTKMFERVCEPLGFALFSFVKKIKSWLYSWGTLYSEIFQGFVFQRCQIGGLYRLLIIQPLFSHRLPVTSSKASRVNQFDWNSILMWNPTVNLALATCTAKSMKPKSQIQCNNESLFDSFHKHDFHLQQFSSFCIFFLNLI